MTAFSDLQFQRSGSTGDWRVINGGAAAWFAAGSHSAGAELAARLVAMAGRLPDIDVRSTGVHVFLPRPAGGFTRAEAERAGAISAAALALGLHPDPSVPRGYQVTIDTPDHDVLMPFWERALGYVDAGWEHLVDPIRRTPSLWFQAMDAPRPLRNRIHLDVSRPGGLEAADAPAAGGTFAEGPYGLRAADADGNEVDLVPAGTMGSGTEDWHGMFTGAAAWDVSGNQAAQFIAAVAALADEAGVAVSIDVRDGLVIVDSGKDVWETDDRFVPLAARIQAVARSTGFRPDASRLGYMQVFVDAVDVPRVREFWRVVLGYEADAREGVMDLYDPRRLGPEFSFQPIVEDDPERLAQRGRIHIDLFVPDDMARDVVARAIAVGGRLVAENLPHGWLLADPEGNEVDIAVVPGRPQ